MDAISCSSEINGHCSPLQFKVVSRLHGCSYDDCLHAPVTDIIPLTC